MNRRPRSEKPVRAAGRRGDTLRRAPLGVMGYVGAKSRCSSGMALLLTLTVVTLLVVTAMELHRRSRTAVVAAAAARDRIVLSQMLNAGVQAAMAMLVKDRRDNEVDSVQDDWANPAKIDALLQSIAFEEGTLKLKINDERSRIQVNSLVKFPEGREFNEQQRMLWERFLKPIFAFYEHPAETDPVNTIVNSLKDWLDRGDDDAITGLSGAESDYYRDLDPPYDCRNGPLALLDELLQVRGITPELYHGAEELPGISAYLTVGAMTDDGGRKGTFDGRININTADIPVLMALLPEENQELATALFDYREEKDGETYTHELSGATWYKNVPGAGDLEIDAALITTRSDFFRIAAEATLNDQTLRAEVQVVRERVGESDRVRCRVLSWQAQ